MGSKLRLGFQDGDPSPSHPITVGAADDMGLTFGLLVLPSEQFRQVTSVLVELNRRSERFISDRKSSLSSHRRRVRPNPHRGPTQYVCHRRVLQSRRDPHPAHVRSSARNDSSILRSRGASKVHRRPVRCFAKVGDDRDRT